ncbi:M23 family metallopeptidase [uncultured Cohaesibacter sp.]|uniref:M23 family metallopeptidase n=1 Tax=uncultured Cohaesibacter sp. TaxID=1002546 RepID=UPI0029306750|nr:M23 family metallopeptidase [uncultured Cohaesibacter sp.]
MRSQVGNKEFGRRKEPHRIIIAHGDTVQDFTIRPWVVSSFIILGVFFSIIYLSATAYLVFRDDIISFSRSEQAMMQAKYEDRIAKLRSQIDRIASRQMIDKQTLEDHVQDLMRKQADYEAYSSVLEPIISKARKAGLPIRSEMKVPLPRKAPWRKKDKQAKATEAPTQKPEDLQLAMASASSVSATPTEAEISNRFSELTKLGFRSTNSFNSDSEQIASTYFDSEEPLFLADASPIEPDLEEPENQTIFKLTDASSRLEKEMMHSKAILNNLLTDLHFKSVRVEQRIASLGIDMQFIDPEAAIGGPYIPLTEDYNHDQLAEEAEKVELALDRFMQLKSKVRSLPITHPLPSGHLTSKFGIRKDPFLGNMSMHSGIDLGDLYGNPIRAAGEGVVTYAGARSGYGLMVEVDHDNGVVSRYAHMSKTLVKKGERVRVGTILGKVGSTGRSTGPHLHFETRVNGRAVNPYSFLIAGKELHKIL